MKTQEEFTREYCERSKMSEAELLGRRRVLRCYCGDLICEGWACVPLDMIECHMKTDGQPPSEP